MKVLCKFIVTTIIVIVVIIVPIGTHVFVQYPGVTYLSVIFVSSVVWYL